MRPLHNAPYNPPRARTGTGKNVVQVPAVMRSLAMPVCMLLQMAKAVSGTLRSLLMYLGSKQVVCAAGPAWLVLAHILVSLPQLGQPALG